MEGKGSRRKRDALTPHFCEIPFCGYRRFFQRHRIVPGREGGRYKLGNVIALCPNHHAEADAGLLPREELLEIVRIRIERDERQRSTEAESPDTQELEEGWSGSAEEPEPSHGAGPPDAEDGIEVGVAPE